MKSQRQVILDWHFKRHNEMRPRSSYLRDQDQDPRCQNVFKKQNILNSKINVKNDFILIYFEKGALYTLKNE